MKAMSFIKKTLCILCAVACLAGFLTGCSSNEESQRTGVLLYDTFDEYVENSKHLHPETDRDLRYALYDNFAQVIECISDNPDIVIPDLYKGVPVIGVRDGAFMDNETMKHLTIGSYVLQIGESAFKNCTALTYVKMSSSVNQIGAEAFYGCLKLTSIVIPPRVQEIFGGTFSNCPSLRKVVVESLDMAVDENSDDEEPVERIMYANTFADCKHLAIMWIPEDITTVEDTILGGETPRPLICGGDSTASSWFATLQCLDYELVARDDFDTHARRYNETTAIVKTEIGKRLGVGQLTVTMDEVSTYKKLGSVTAGENQVLLAIKFTIYNNTMISQYFNGLAVKCTSSAPGKDGIIEDFNKLPIMLSSNVLGLSYPVGYIPANNQKEAVIVLRVSERYESVSIQFLGAEEPFII